MRRAAAAAVAARVPAGDLHGVVGLEVAALEVGAAQLHRDHGDWDGGPDPVEDTGGLTHGGEQAPSIPPRSATPDPGGLDHAAEVAERMSPVFCATARRTAS